MSTGMAEGDGRRPGGGNGAHAPTERAGADGFGPPDAEVVARVVDGHQEDFTVLIRRYQGRFHRFALGMVDDPDAATDLVQDSFIKAYTSLDSCNDPEKFEAWAYQILRNRCRDHLKNVRRAHEPLEEAPDLVSTIGMPAEELDRAELRRTLREALASLPGAHREAFLLKHLEGYSYPEIAQMLGASLSAVKMRVHRSREMLREHIEATTPDGDVTIPRTGSSSEQEAAVGADHSRRMEC